MALSGGLYLKPGALVVLGAPPTDGVTGVGTMPRGTLYVGLDGNLYINRGTKASPLWYTKGTATGVVQ